MSNVAGTPEWNLTHSLLLIDEQKVMEGDEDLADQGTRGICGPMALIHALEIESPTRLVTLAENVYETRAHLPDDLVLSTSLKNEKHPLSIILATYLLNEHANFLTYHGTSSASDDVASGCSASDVKQWLEELFPNRTITSYSSYCWGAFDNAQEVNTLWRQPGKKPVVLAILNQKYLQKSYKPGSAQLPAPLASLNGLGHCVHITTPFYCTPDNLIEFDAYTWGETRHFRLSKSEFKRMLWELVVAK